MAAAANILFPVGKQSPILMPSLLSNGWRSMSVSFYGIAYQSNLDFGLKVARLDDRKLVDKYARRRSLDFIYLLYSS
jgi:hypothetical protein